MEALKNTIDTIWPIAVLGVIVYLIDRFVPMNEAFKVIIYVIAILFVLVYLYNKLF